MQDSACILIRRSMNVDHLYRLFSILYLLKLSFLLSDVVEIPLEMVKTTAMEYESTSDLIC